MEGGGSQWQPQLRALIAQKLDRIVQLGRYRSLPSEGNYQQAIDVSHNDYLALSQDANLQKALLQAAEGLSVGSRASRLLRFEPQQTIDIYLKLEATFADFKNAPSALYYGSGYAANQDVILALSQKRTQFFFDESIHASMRDGLRQSPIPRSHQHSFEHNNLDQLDHLLAASGPGPRVILIESLYAMAGDQAPIAAIIKLAETHDAMLVVDEAHALGVVGSLGEGLCSGAVLDHQKHITINPCGKGLAAQGCFVCGPPWFRDYLINTSRRFIYTTAPSPWLVAALQHIIQVMPQMKQQRQSLRRNVATFCQSLAITAPTGAVVCLATGDEAQTLAAAAFLRQHGILPATIRPPTVPAGGGLLRISLNAGLNEHEIKRLSTVCLAAEQEGLWLRNATL